jgi:hypothetical protein
MPPQSPIAVQEPVAMVFFQLSQKLSKSANMAFFIPGVLGVSYATFAFFRYTGACRRAERVQLPPG